MANQIKRLINGNIELTLTIPWTQMQQGYEQVIAETIKNTEIKGFRKGHAPRKLIEDKLDRSQTFSHALQHVLPKAYQAAIDEHKLKPVIYPSIKIDTGKEGSDWVFTATICEAPEVILGKLVKLEDLVKSSTVKIADLLVKAEADHRLTALAENLTRLGLTVDKYLTSKKMTAADLKAKLAEEARQDLNTEFILQQVQVENKLADRPATLAYLQNLV